MNHKDVFKAFQSIFSIGTVDTWWQNGYNSVRIRFENRKEVVFTYEHDTKWKLETLESFLDKMNKH